MERIKGPGLMWVASHISASSQSVLDEATFLQWYDEDHIPEIISTDGINDAFRYVDVEKKTAVAGTPFLAFYPMEDLAFTQGPAFKNIKVKSELLPGSGVVYDMAEFDVRYLGLIDKTDGRGKSGPAKYLLLVALEPGEGVSEESVKEFYDQQLDIISRAPHYLRSLRFKLLYARNNAQSRALKGLATTEEPVPDPPTWHVVHEFSEEPESELRRKIEEDSSEVLQKARQREIRVYRLAKVQGGGRCLE